MSDAQTRAMAEAYQAVGALGEAFGLADNEHFIRLQDTLAYGRTEDWKDLLPFPATAEELAPNALTALKAKLDRARDFIDMVGGYELSLTDMLERRAVLAELDADQPKEAPETQISPPAIGQRQA